jgi:hypothetical protein
VPVSPFTGPFGCVRAPAIAPNISSTFTGLIEERRYDHTSRSSEPEAVVCSPKTLELCVAVGFTRRPGLAKARTPEMEGIAGFRVPAADQNTESRGLWLEQPAQGGDRRVVVSIDGGKQGESQHSRSRARRGRRS